MLYKSNFFMILFPTALKSPAAFHEQRRSLERARVRPFFPQEPPEPIVLLVDPSSLVEGPALGSAHTSVPDTQRCLFHPAIPQHVKCDQNFSFTAFKGV